MSESERGSGGTLTSPPRERRHRAADRRQGERRGASVRIAAVGDFHCGEQDTGVYRTGFARASEEADLLLLAGDLTRWGTPAEMRVAVGELADVEIPIACVLGNHDHEAGEVVEVTAILRDRGVHVLDGDIFQLNEQVGVAGVKGFMGGFGARTLTAFGEAETKTFVSTTLDDVKKLEVALRRLPTPIRIALLHYAPVVDTVVGEPEQIYPFLGNDRLAEPLDRYGVAVVFHGHAHHGAFRGTTPGGTPVFNVSHDLIRREGAGEMYYLHEIPISPSGEAAGGAGEERATESETGV